MDKQTAKADLLPFYALFTVLFAEKLKIKNH